MSTTIDTTVPTQPIRVLTVSYFTARFRGASEFYSGIRNGEKVRVKVEVTTYSHGGKVKTGSPVLSIQSIENPGGWLCQYDSYEFLEDIRPA